MVETTLRALLAPVVDRLGLDLEDVEVSTAGRRRKVCVIVDRDGGVDLDAVADVSKAVSDALDASDALGNAPYVLEVSSPGVDRPLTDPRHWRRARGRLVTCRLTSGESIEGRIVASNDETVTLETSGGPWTSGFDDIAQGRVQVEFRRTDDEVE
ncbi:MAG: ribosome maturation factor RimP [Actinomycetota bacterium]